MSETNPSPRENRRQFLKSLQKRHRWGFAGSESRGPPGPPMPRAATSKVGLIGCGGRGSGAAGNALNAGRECQATGGHGRCVPRPPGRTAARQLKKQIGRQVRRGRRPRVFTASTPTRRSIDSGVDVVLLLPSRPISGPLTCGRHRSRQARVLREAGRRRRPGRAQRAGDDRAGRQKNLNLVSGLCWRYDLRRARDDEADPRRRDRRHRRHPGDLPHRHALASRPRARSGARWSTRCATGTTSPGSRATTSSSSTSTASTRPCG